MLSYGDFPGIPVYQVRIRVYVVHAASVHRITTDALHRTSLTRCPLLSALPSIHIVSPPKLLLLR